jgi:hypothetical protein
MELSQSLMTHHPLNAGGRRLLFARRRQQLLAFAIFPVTFRSTLDALPFMITSILVLFFAIAPGNNDPNPNLYGATFNLLKYAFAAILITWFALLAIVRQRINPLPLFPMAALILAVAGVGSLIYSLAVEPGTTTYASALIPLFLVSLPLAIPASATRASGAVATEYLFRLIGTAAIFHVLWYLVDYASGMTDADPGSYCGLGFAIAPVSLMILSGLSRRKILLSLSVGVIGLSLVLRPSSTTGFIAIFAIAVIVVHRLFNRRLFRFTCVFIVGTIILGNLFVFISADFAETLYSIEPLIKEDALEAKSNNGFRLGIISAVRDEMADRPLLAGKFFSGDVTVNPRKYYPNWEVDYVTIHSDYIIMIQQGGLIGYGLFASLWIGMALFCARAARLAHVGGNNRSEILFDAIQAINITYMLCISGNPTMFDMQYSLWHLMLMPLTIFLARALPGLVGRIPRRRSGPSIRVRKML